MGCSFPFVKRHSLGSDHAVERAASYAGGLGEGISVYGKSRLFVAGYGSSVPGADLQIQRFLRVQLFGDGIGGGQYGLPVMPAAVRRIHTDSQKNLGFLLQNIHKANQLIFLPKSVEVFVPCRIKKTICLCFIS